MATQANLPYGLTDLYGERLDASDTPVTGSGVRLINGQTMEVTINEDQTDEEGYGVVVGTVYSATSADLSIHSAGVDLDFLALITGGTVASSLARSRATTRRRCRSGCAVWRCARSSRRRCATGRSWLSIRSLAWSRARRR